MQDKRREVSRRTFISQAGAAGMLGGLALAGGLGCAQHQLRAHDGTQQKHAGESLPRRTLAEAGPMLPPVPAVLLSINGQPGDPDELSVVWSFVLEGKPPLIGIAPGDEHIAGKLVALHQEFVLNVPSAAIVKPFDIVDMNSSTVQDKYKLSGLTRGKAVKVDAPTVEEAPIQLECKVTQSLRVPPQRTLFVAEVVAVTVHPGVCDENGRLNVDETPFFGMTSGSGEFYTMGKCVGHIGQSVGRDDIKY